MKIFVRWGKFTLLLSVIVLFFACPDDLVPEEDLVTIKFDANGATSGTVPATIEVNPDSLYTIPGNTGDLHKPDSLFDGWSDLKTPLKIYQAGEKYLLTTNVVFYAQWRENSLTYSIKYFGNGHTGGTVPVDPIMYHTNNNAFIKEPGTLAKTGYTFKEWNTKADGSGITYMGNDQLTIQNRSLVLYAQWVPAAIYEVIYNGNGNTGGTIPVDTLKYQPNSNALTKENTGLLVKTGFTFKEWNTAANGTGTSYSPKSLVPIVNSNVTLYAQWEAIGNSFTVSYNGNGNSGGTVPTDTNRYNTGDTAVVLTNSGVLVKTGQLFQGWNDKADGNGKSYAPNAKVVIASTNITLFAQWATINTFSVTYFGNTNDGGTAPIDTIIYTSGQEATVLGNTGLLTKNNHSFDGWNTKADGSGTSYNQAEKFVMGSSNVTLYAQWKDNGKFKITYDGNNQTNGFPPNDPTEYASGATVMIMGNNTSDLPLVKTGFAFTGWNTEANGSGTDYTPDSQITITSNLTLYAKWTPPSK